MFFGCKKEVDFDKLQNRNGILYEINSEKGFSGISKKYYENGQVLFEGIYKDGILNGKAKWYYENGEFETGRNYKDGILISVF